MNEEELIKKAQKGDKASLAAIVRLYEQTIYNFAFKICRDKDRAEHSMQETFLSLVKNISQFSGNSKLSTWLYTVVSNHCLMLARSNKKRNHASIDDNDNLIAEKNLAVWNVSPDKITENEELKEILDEVISKLPQEYKIVFLLRDIEGLSTEETGKILSLSIPAVKSRLHRARAFLRNQLNTKLSHE